ncbi:unnamed protein product, partial [Phaeothamnion confervicola]
MTALSKWVRVSGYIRWCYEATSADVREGMNFPKTLLNLGADGRESWEIRRRQRCGNSGVGSDDSRRSSVENRCHCDPVACVGAIESSFFTQAPPLLHIIKT